VFLRLFSVATCPSLWISPPTSPRFVLSLRSRQGAAAERLRLSLDSTARMAGLMVDFDASAASKVHHLTTLSVKRLRPCASVDARRVACRSLFCRPPAEDFAVEPVVDPVVNPVVDPVVDL